jgi:DNA-directed RNA polymerase alpha subunit
MRVFECSEAASRDTIDVLALGAETYNGLRRAGILTIVTLLERSASDLMRLPAFRPALLRQVQVALANHGLSLAIERATQAPKPPTSIMGEHVSVLETGVEALSLSVRAGNCFRRSSIVTIGDLVRKSEAELLKLRNFGITSLREVEAELSRMGLRLGMEVAKQNDGGGAAESSETPADVAGVQDRRCHLTGETFGKLSLRVDEMQLSVRTERCLRSASICHVGELVRCGVNDLLELPGLGKQGLREIESKLNMLGLACGVAYEQWTVTEPNSMTQCEDNAVEEVRQMLLINFLGAAHAPCRCIEDEISVLRRCATHDRNWQIIREYSGWSGGERAKLAEIAKKHRLSEAGVLQICNRFEANVARSPIRQLKHAPLLRKAEDVLLALTPCSVLRAKEALVAAGLSDGSIGLRGVLTYERVATGGQRFFRERLNGYELLISSGQEGWLGHAISGARKMVLRHGLGSISNLRVSLQVSSGAVFREEGLADVVSTLENLVWLGEDRNWFVFLPLNERNTLARIIGKILYVGDEITLRELQMILDRSRVMRGLAIPTSVLEHFCDCTGFGTVRDERVVRIRFIDEEEFLSAAEKTIVAVLREHGPLMSTVDLQDRCVQRGMPGTTCLNQLALSPVVKRYRSGIYGLRGAHVGPEELNLGDR